jgi:hypothetical protein
LGFFPTEFKHGCSHKQEAIQLHTKEVRCSMTISNVSASVLAPQAAPASAIAATSQVTSNPLPPEDNRASLLPRMQNLGLTNLRQTLMQSVSDQLVSTRLSVNSDQAKGAALTIAGGVAKVVGQSMTKSGGASSKAAGMAMVWGGKTAEKIGKATYKEAGKDHETGSYNAFAPRNWAR